MTLDKIDVLYNPDAVDHYKTSDSLPHYKKFINNLKPSLNTSDVVIVKSWMQVRENSLIILYEYDGFYQELINFAGDKNLHFYRRIFIISNRLREFYHPSGYQNKSFIGSLHSTAYDFFTRGGNLGIKYSDLRVDNLALSYLKNNIDKERWFVNQDLSNSDGYELVYCSINLADPLAIYFNEYMEKFDQLKDIDKFAAPEEKPVKKSWWKRILGKK